MNYRLIALDIDGTLITDEHELTPRVKRAVRACAERGAEIVLCTGRDTESALSVLEELELSGAIVTLNGASVVDSRTRRVLHETALAAEEAALYLRYCRERGIHFDMNTAFELYVESVTEEAAATYKRLGIRPRRWEAAGMLPDRTLKLSVNAAKEVLDEAEREWSRWEMKELQFVRSGDYFLDVQPRLASKGEAVKRLAELKGVPRGQVIAIGNYYNDVGMIEYAGLGVAMANSPGAVKEAADAVTASNNEEGVADVLEAILTKGGFPR